ncbi:uncharacterized protein BO80DRAFT_379015 [Aspergillus ibericus CBS 121593]|uniref:BTB domain-containing protein n=1 Tax=Aspergillus ibericus CBS 121593 TaxID=1448316 RepID=A0A395H4U2_9EURO|nr:hypothetical protein BO80DRAFT_379015 [Aspergillus ibericus CBS 121593]RAL02499.1 hypothetical protein BO80DRAFT_379015 [Aspergillus ibericus CBS 121593]
MTPPTHIIDPDGEVIIILRNANAPFAQPDEDIIAGVASDPLKASDSVQSLAAEAGRPGAEGISSTATHAPSPIEESSSASTEEPPAEEQPVEEQAETGSSPESPDEDCIRIQVSAKHLIFASSVFKKTLTGGWKESVTYLQKGSVEITAEGWDLVALLILLRAIHGQYYSVPRKLTLERLAKVAVLIDYYKCKETMYPLTDIWLKALEEPIPTTCSRDLILWLWVSWFFQLPAQFKKSTSTAMSCSTGWISSLGLPISYSVLKSMNDRRQEAINNLVVLVHETREALLSGSQGCGFECSSMMYGALSKQMHSSNLLSPRPAAPFPNLIYKDLVQQLLAFKSPRWYGYDSSSYYDSYSHQCSASSFKSIFRNLDSTVHGLDLESSTV